MESYIVTKLHLSDEVLLHSKLVNIEKRQYFHFSNFEYLVKDLKEFYVLVQLNIYNEIFDEFVDYQLLLSTDILSLVWDSSKDTYDDEDANAHAVIRMDVIWRP